GPRAGLEDVDRELVVVLARGDVVGRLGDAVGQIALEETQIGVHPRCRRLDPAEPVDHRPRNALAGDRKVLNRLAGLCAPELLRGLVAYSHWFNSIRSQIELETRDCRRSRLCEQN